MDDRGRVHEESIEPGELVYDSDRRPIGRISGLTEEGFEVEAVDPTESEIEELPGQEFGEGYLMWRCTECGEMDELDDGMPESCPACGAPGEAISAVEED
jgi:rubrerythrin